MVAYSLSHLSLSLLWDSISLPGNYAIIYATVQKATTRDHCACHSYTPSSFSLHLYFFFLSLALGLGRCVCFLFNQVTEWKLWNIKRHSWSNWSHPSILSPYINHTYAIYVPRGINSWSFVHISREVVGLAIFLSINRLLI